LLQQKRTGALGIFKLGALHRVRDIEQDAQIQRQRGEAASGRNLDHQRLQEVAAQRAKLFVQGSAHRNRFSHIFLQSA
jgi:hypothetical protein